MQKGLRYGIARHSVAVMTLLIPYIVFYVAGKLFVSGAPVVLSRVIDEGD